MRGDEEWQKIKGDLISREALKKHIFIAYQGNGVELEPIEVVPLCEIDNAPTVIADYDTGYQDGLEDGLNDIRPQGEWLDEKFVAFHLTCNKCGCNIRRQKEEVFEGDYAYNFCPNCGTDMRGGVE